MAIDPILEKLIDDLRAQRPDACCDGHFAEQMASGLIAAYLDATDIPAPFAMEILLIVIDAYAEILEKEAAGGPAHPTVN